MWPRFRKWLAEKIVPKAEQLEQTVEGVVNTEVRRIAPGAPSWLARFLLVLCGIALYVAGSWLYWRLQPVKPGPGLTSVATQGGEKNPGYAAPPVKGLARVSKRPTERSVQSTPVASLPKKEQGYAPIVPPAAGKDNVVRTEPELLTSSVVPGSRGDTDVRTWLNPDGSAQNVLTPQRESFFGWPWANGNWKRVELEGRYGLVGNTQAKATARWLPIRLGDLQGGIEGSVAAERAGTIRGEGMLMIRYEPFRSKYR